MSDRGDYRSFYCVFWDDPDVHAMSDNAYRVLTTIKGTLNAAGIGTVYLSQLAERCGKSLDQLESGLAELERPKGDSDYGWIVREKSIIWIVNGLRFEPTLTSANKKHKKFLRERLLAPLGERTSIVAAFRRHYPEWFVDSVPSSPETDRDTDSRQEEQQTPDSVPAKPIGIPGTQDTLSQTPGSTVQSIPILSNPTQSIPVVVDEYANSTDIAIWSNLAAAEQWGERTEPYTPGQSADIAEELRALGVTREFVKRSIYRQCRECGLKESPRTPKYFLPGAKLDWERELSRRATAARKETAPPRTLHSRGKAIAAAPKATDYGNRFKGQ